MDVITRPIARLGGTINQVCAAICMAHRAANLEDPTNTNLMIMFRKGLINIRTKRAQKKATPVDQQKLNELFLNWEDNENLSNVLLRLASHMR